MLVVMHFFFCPRSFVSSLFFFNDTSTSEIYTLSLHDALPILAIRGFDSGSRPWPHSHTYRPISRPQRNLRPASSAASRARSEEHTSELQSRFDLVCRLLLERKKI